MMCLTPGMPAAFDVARAWRPGGGDRHGLLPTIRAIALLCIASAQIIFRGHDRRALRRRMRIELSSITASTRQSRTSARRRSAWLGARNIQCFSPSFARRGRSSSWCRGRAAADAVVRLFFLHDALRRGPRLEVETRRELMTFSGQVASQSPHCTQTLSVNLSIADQVVRSAPVGQAVTQAWHSVQPSTLCPPRRRERRARAARHRPARGRRGEAHGMESRARRASRREAHSWRVLRGDAAQARIEHGAELVRIVGLDDPHESLPKPSARRHIPSVAIARRSAAMS